MKSTSVRLSEEMISEIKSFGMSVGEFVRNAVDEKMERRKNPGSTSSGPPRQMSFSAKEMPSIDGKSFESISEDLDLRIAACGEVTYEAIMVLNEHSVPRKLCYVDNLSQARYENSVETFICISQNRYPEIKVATGSDFRFFA